MYEIADHEELCYEAFDFAVFCEKLWRKTKYLVKLQCQGCDKYSFGYQHTCQKLYIEHYLIDEGFLAYIYDLYFDEVIIDLLELLHYGRLTRYKKAKLRQDVVIYCLDRVKNKSLYS